MKLRFTYISLFLLFCLQTFGQNVCINEVVYSNKSVLEDSFGETPDLIELYNASDKDVNLSNWLIIDDTTKSTYWKFPNVVIPAKSFLVLYASGRDGVFENELHLKFKLGSMKDGVCLFDAKGKLVSKMQPQCSPTNTSLAREQDGGNSICVLEPTIGFSNNDAEKININYESTSLTLEKTSGLYEKPFELHVSATNKNAQIYYTIDGTDPNEGDSLYKDFIYIYDRTVEKNDISNIPTSDIWIKPNKNIFKGTALKVQAYSNGCPASKIYTNTYFVNSAIKERYDVPIVSIITEPDNLFDDEIGIYVIGNDLNYNKKGSDWERESHIEIIDTNENTILKQTFGLRISGSFSRTAPQKSLRLFAKEKYGVPYFHYPNFDENIDTVYTMSLRTTKAWTYALFKDEISHELLDPTGIENMQIIPVVVFINGEYWGLHSLREHQENNYLNRANGSADKDFDVIKYTPSRIYADEGTMDDYNEFTSFLKDNSLADSENYKQACSFIDVDNLIDYFVAQIYFANGDFTANNIRLWKESNADSARWRYLFYDCDGCLSNINYRYFHIYNADDHPLNYFGEWPTIIFDSFLENRDFRNKFQQRFYHHLNTTFSPEVVLKKIEEYETLYEPMAAEHILRWGYPNNILKWKENVTSLKMFALQRPIFMMEELKENFTSPFAVFPNPLPQGDYLKIKAEDLDGDITVRIYDLEGKQVLTQTQDVSKEELLYSNELESGYYILKIEYGQFCFYSKLFVL